MATTTSRFFDPFHDFDWSQWTCNEYRKKYTKQMMIRLKKIPWLSRQLPSSILPHHFEVCQLAVLHGLPDKDIPTFKDHWQRTRHIYTDCPDADIHEYFCSDWMTIASFDKCVAELIPSSMLCQKLAEHAKSQQLHLGLWKEPTTLKNLSPELVYVNPPVVPTLVPTVALQHQPSAAVATTTIEKWQIPKCKLLEHVRLLRMLGRDRGNYIGQIGPCEFKFGLTDKDFGARTDQHLKDFDQFCLVWAQHCFNASRAEMLFKKDPRIMPRLIKRNTNKNRHREIIQIDAECTEFTIKEIYQEYVQMVNNEERAKMNLNGGEVALEKSPEPPVKVTDSNKVQSDIQMLELEKQKLAFEKEKWQHELDVRLKEIELKSLQMKQEQQRLNATVSSPEMNAARILCHMRNDHTKPTAKKLLPYRRYHDGQCIEQISPVSNKVIHRFTSLKQAQKQWPALMLSRKELLRSIKSGSFYKGWLWRCKK